MSNPSAAFLLRTSFLALALSAGILASGGQAHAQSRGPYVDAGTYLIEDDARFEAWYHLRRQLAHNFDDICGDTFCEGDFTNLEALSFRCSVSTRTGQLRRCLWLFAGSYETVTASTGNIRPTARFFHCPVPLTGTPAAALDALLAPGERGPLWNPMPGTTQSIYDTLIDCL
jgi:hypothetical protein